MSTPLQHAWLAKLMGYDYEIVYKKGCDNSVVDALSRVSGAEIFQQILVGLNSVPLPAALLHFTYDGTFLRRRGGIVLGNCEEVREEILLLYHGSDGGGISGVHATY